ncbi:MAG TPA: S8 family peptidase [Abditibacteriaceae bacterium]|nr:S8 family peptidase [Abditibacteriaceae bacterium]
MNRRTRLLAASAGVAVVLATALPMLPVWMAQREPATTANTAQLASSQVIVVDLDDDATAGDIGSLGTRYNLNLQANSIYSGTAKLMRARLSGTQNIQALLAQLRQDSQVEAAEAEITFAIPEQGRQWQEAVAAARTSPQPPRRFFKRGFVPNDPRYPEQWNFQMIGAPQAWQYSQGKGVVVAVIDTGVAGRDSPRGQRAQDFDRTRFVKGYDFVNDDDDPYDDNGHGTHVAGTVAESTNNKKGVAGLAFAARVMPLKVLSAEGWGTSGDVADAIRFAADHGANVINLSLGSLYPSEIVHEAVKYAAQKRVVVVCAAGNGFGPGVGYPAAFPESIAVSSVGPSGAIAFYSSYGDEVTLAAPGGDTQGGEQDGILQNTVFPEDQGGRGDGYYFFQGTSMASPHVAATAALLMAQGVRDPEIVRDLLVQAAAPREPKQKYGAGILSAGKATSLVAAQHFKSLIKRLLFLVLAGLILLRPRRVALGRRLALVAALGIGVFGPDWMAALVGFGSPWNLITFSAVVPFILFWELEEGYGSKLVAVLACGVALCLFWDQIAGTTPFTFARFGQRALLWICANIGAALFIAGLAWLRSDAER